MPSAPLPASSAAACPTVPLASRRPVPARPAALALWCACGLAAATAQTPPAAPAPSAPEGETIVLEAFEVATVRASLMEAKELKQNTVQLVDSIVAQDIGKLPDNSVADALQRLPGIQVGRGNGEVGTVLIRGLPNLGTTLNGHEIFTGTGRGVALQDIPAELIAGVDVYKTSSAEQIEGGIAGLIDIRLRRPLDFPDLMIASGGRAIYGENAGKMSWVGSALVSDRWKTAGGGDVGALFAASYQRRNFIDQTIFNFLFEETPTTVVPGLTSLQLPLTQGSLVIPGERDRTAYSTALQWRPNDELELYSDFLYTGYRDERQVHFLIGFPRFGAFTAAEVHPGTNVPTTTTSVNNFHLTSTQAFKDRTDGYQGVVGAKWRRGPVHASTELVYNWSSFKNRAIIVDTQFAPATPGTFTFGYNNSGRADLRITGADVTDGANYALWGLFDNHGSATSDQLAWRADGEYVLESGFLDSIKAGIRFTDREAKNRQTSVNDIPPVGGRGVVRTASIPGFGSVSPDGVFSSSDYGTPNWFGADPTYLYENTAAVRQLFGRPVADPDFNPTQSFTDTEKTYAAYLQASYSATLGERPLDGFFGVRVVRTEQTLLGFRADESLVSSDEQQTDVLPVVNARLKLRDDLLLRFSAGRTVTRPNFADLNPVATLNAPTTTGGGAGTGSGGNPELQSVTSDNYDLALEHYFARASYVSLTAFLRSIDGYVQSFAATENIGGVDYIVVRPRNAGQGELYGFELTYQHFPEFFPEPLKGFGWQTNFTFIEGETDTADTTPGAPVGARVKKDYAQVSRTSYNLIAIYERGPFSTRLAFNWRGKFTDTFDGPNAPGSPLRQIIVKPTETLDFSASYQLGEHLTLTFDITNVLNSEYQDYFHDETLYPRDTRAYDRTFALGARYKF